MRVQVKLAGTRLINKDYDLCAELKRFGQSCPFNSNYISVSKEMHLDKRIPKVGSAQRNLRGFTKPVSAYGYSFVALTANRSNTD